MQNRFIGSFLDLYKEELGQMIKVFKLEHQCFESEKIEQKYSRKENYNFEILLPCAALFASKYSLVVVKNQSRLFFSLLISFLYVCMCENMVVQCGPVCKTKGLYNSLGRTEVRSRGGGLHDSLCIIGRAKLEHYVSLHRGRGSK